MPCSLTSSFLLKSYVIVVGLLIQDAESSEQPPSQTYHKSQLLCSAGEKRKGQEEIMSLLSSLSKNFNIAGAFLHILPSRDSSAMRSLALQIFTWEGRLGVKFVCMSFFQ